MTTIITILTPGFADWETALLNAVAHSFYKAHTKFATPGGAPVTSAGGMSVTPDMAIEEIDPEALDVLVLCGGSAWSQPDAPDVSVLVNAVHAAGKPVASICDATLALAKSGLLDSVKHTSNDPENLPKTGYRGAALYQARPTAVLDGNMITAPGTAPVSFMAAIMQALGLRDDNLNYYLGLHAAEHQAA